MPSPPDRPWCHVAGKSTFLKLLTGEIEPTEGHVGRHAKLIVAKFTQHHIEMMDPEKASTPSPPYCPLRARPPLLTIP